MVWKYSLVVTPTYTVTKMACFKKNEKKRKKNVTLPLKFRVRHQVCNSNCFFLEASDDKKKNLQEVYYFSKKSSYLCGGGLAEWSNAAALKTVVPKGTGGSNPSASAVLKESLDFSRLFCVLSR